MKQFAARIAGALCGPCGLKSKDLRHESPIDDGGFVVVGAFGLSFAELDLLEGNVLVGEL